MLNPSKLLNGAIFLISVCVFAKSVRAEPNEANATQVVKATVTDREDQPIEGASVVKIDWFSLDETEAPEVLTNAEGDFEFFVSKDASENSNFVVIFKEGYAIGALNLDALPARARLWKKKPVALRIVDAKQIPVEAARVTLGEVGFEDEFLIANVPAALGKLTGTTSRADGWAILRSTRPEFLHSITVKAEGYGSQSFACSFSDTKFQVLQLWDTTPIDLVVLDGQEAAVGWTVSATSNDFLAAAADENWTEKNPLNGNFLPKGISFTGKTDERGRLTLNHVLLKRRMHFLLVDSKGQWRGSDTVVANGGDHSIATLQVESSVEQKGTQYDCQVVEESSGEGVSGVEVSFQQPQLPYKSVKATSGNEGSLKVKLVPGTWRLSITEAPDGYCKVLHSAPQIVVPEQGKRTLPKVKIPKGKTIEGTIRGVDLAIRRTRWIHVSWSRGDGESDQVYGWYKPDGTFRVAIPEEAIADTFEIVRVGGGGSDELVIESKDPLVLTSLAE